MTRTNRGRTVLLCLCALGAFAAGCGDDEPMGEPDMGTTGPMDLGGEEPDLAPTERDAFVPPGGDRFVLAAGDWTLPAGTEGYRCVRATIDETIFVHEFFPIAPLGTHHTVVTFDTTPSIPDGVEECNATTNAPDMIYGSGVGTDPLTLPDGVAVKIPAGSQILVNLHLFNASGEELTGNSGIEVVTYAEASVEHEAEVLLGGPVGFSIPARTEGHVIDGGCTMQDDVTIFGMMPHMHEYGVYMSVEAEGTTLFDGPYSFDNQKYRIFDEPLQVSAGTRVNVECTYDNPTDRSVGFGDSTLQEMCFALLYRYPALGDGVFCAF
ncbi:MAG: hypothetical protein CMN30_31975 [Sandaracinus sp.]|nr:hypothetical protein [Sandaracinus sp.]MAQ19405.1 hypothetical protein [Sandaracinus sp.]